VAGEESRIVPTVEPEGLSGPEVLEHTAAEGRVLVTANIRDFEPISREWAGEDLHPPWPLRIP
jgi:hypothetical protein